MALVFALIKLLHIIGAATWIGGMVILLAGPMRASIRGGGPGPVVEYLRAYGWVLTGGLLLAAVTGLALGLMRAPPGEWLNFGNPEGRVGEKVALFVALLLAGAIGHVPVVRGLREGKEWAGKALNALLIIALIITLALALTGTLLRLGI